VMKKRTNFYYLLFFMGILISIRPDIAGAEKSAKPDNLRRGVVERTIDSTQPHHEVPIQIDSEAAESIINWAKSESLVLPEDWRSKQPYSLTRQWAGWSGQPDSDIHTIESLKKVLSLKKKNLKLTSVLKAELLMGELLKRKKVFIENAVSYLSSYLPTGTPIKGRILFALYIPPYAFAWAGNIVVDLAAKFWEGNAEKVLNLLVHELYHNGFTFHHHGTPSIECDKPNALLDHLLWQTQNEGMATYVAYNEKSDGFKNEDYIFLDTPKEVLSRFSMLRRLIADAKAVNKEQLPEFQKRIWQEGVMSRAFYIVGAYMARRIEESKGRNALIETVKTGPVNFFEAYEETSPPEELRIKLDFDK